MYWSNKRPTKPVKDAPTVELTCSNCHNTSPHALYWIVEGFFFKWAGMLLYGKKRYVYVCPVCKQINKEISRDQAVMIGS